MESIVYLKYDKLMTENELCWLREIHLLWGRVTKELWRC